MRKLCLTLFITVTAVFTFANAENHIPKQNLKTALNQSPGAVENTVADKHVTVQQAPVAAGKVKTGFIDLKEVFSASPIIYTILFAMSVTALIILLYNSLNFRPGHLTALNNTEQLKQYLFQDQYQEALIHCEKNNSLLSSMIAAGIEARQHGPQYVLDSMKDEGRRVTADFWQKLSLLNDIAVIAPMLGLAGTVIGMFYAFYDINRSIDSIAALFDGLGIAVGTTVMGLIVSILAMLFHTVLKYKMTKSLHVVEAKAATIANLIKNQG